MIVDRVELAIKLWSIFVIIQSRTITLRINAFVAGRRFSMVIQVSDMNNTVRHNITEISVNMEFNYPNSVYNT